MEYNNNINALHDAAANIARQIGFCSSTAERCLAEAWNPRFQVDDRRRCFEQAEMFLRLSAELAAGLAKLKGDANTHRQHISVEHLERHAAPDTDGVTPHIAGARAEQDIREYFNSRQPGEGGGAGA